MNKFITAIMYLLWTLTVIFLLAAVFTNFKFIDINAIAIILTAFTILNAFFTLPKKR